MTKRSNYNLGLILSMAGLIALGLGCSQKQDSDALANSAKELQASPEEIKVEILLKEAMKPADAVNAASAISDAARSDLPAACIDPTQPNVMCTQTTETYGNPYGAGPYGPGFEGIYPPYGPYAFDAFPFGEFFVTDDDDHPYDDDDGDDDDGDDDDDDDDDEEEDDI